MLVPKLLGLVGVAQLSEAGSSLSSFQPKKEEFLDFPPGEG